MITNICKHLFDSVIDAPHADKILYHRFGNQVSFKDFRFRCLGTTEFLRLGGIKPRDIVVVVMNDHVHLPAAFIGLVHIGAIPVLLDCKASLDDISYWIEKTGAETVISDRLEINQIELPKLSRYISLMDLNNYMFGQFEGGYEYQPNDIVAYYPTSGVTGQPKLVAYTHQNFVDAAETLDQVLPFTKDERVFTTFKMSTVLGTLINTISPFVTGNTHLLTWITYDNRRLSNSINEHEITTFITDPYVLNAMLKYNSVDFHPGLETVIVSGEHLPETTQKAWVDNTTVKLLNWFTLTENLHPIIQELQPNNKSKCLGKASPTVDLRVVDKQGNECPVGQIGILEFKSKVQGQHYLLDDTQSSFTFVNGWVHSDDLVKVDEDGTYWYVSKTKQQITINNHQLNMLDIESDILTFDEVEDCSVQEIDGTIKIDVMLQLGQELTADSIVSKLNNAAINTGCINFVELISRTLNNKKFVQFAGTTV